jgi:hypothetical protein
MYSDRDLAFIGIYSSVIPTIVIIYFDWRRRRAENYKMAQHWMTNCVAHWWGFLFISESLYNLLSPNLPSDKSYKAVSVEITKESHRFIVDKAQDIFLTRDSLRQLHTAWNKLNRKTQGLIEGCYPFIFSEEAILKVHVILQAYQDGGSITPAQMNDWEKANQSFASSFDHALKTMEQLRFEIDRRFPYWR